MAYSKHTSYMIKKARYNCLWQPMTPENPDGYIVTPMYTRRLLKNKLIKLLKEKQNKTI